MVQGCCGQQFCAGPFWGAQTGPNPTDRGKNRSKRHVISDGQGVPLALIHTGANVHDSQAAMPLVDSIPSIKCPGGGRRRRPDSLYADRAYDAEDKIRKPLRQRR
ncbi:MAG: transposase, partial [Planctomycetota bacterium]